MAEVETFDCPATPEILPVGDSPILVRESLDTSCESEVEDVPADGRSSPPPKCAICLGKCKNKSFTDSCLHQFCFKCLLEWSKIKAECPLCKQIFRSIIHNVRSVDQFDEYVVRPPVAQPPMPHPYIIPHATMPPSVYHRLDFMLSEPPRFTYSATLQVGTQQSEAIQQLFMHRSPSIDRFSREYANDQIPYRQHGEEWRRYIYSRRLFAMPLMDVMGRLRECSAAFYRENPAQIHRLMPWVNRELVALFRENRIQIETVLNYFPELLTRYDITSPEFKNHVHYWGNERTDHFIHELINFARSPFDMIGYDRNVRYSPRFSNTNSDIQVVISSSSENEISDNEDVIRLLNGRRGRTQFTIETRSSHSTVIVTGSFGGESGDAPVNVSTSPGNGGNGNNSSSTTTTGSSNTITCRTTQNRMLPLQLPRAPSNISLSSASDSDDILFVREQKPPHLRTPELVSLNSESDSDVMFVDEQKEEEDTTNQNCQQIENNSNNSKNNINNNSKKVPQPGIFEPSVSSEDSGCNSNNNLSNSLDIKDLPSTSSAFSPQQIVSLAYNNGASTSGEQSGTQIYKKFYARPRMNHSSSNKKSIYESSDSENSSESESDSSSHDEVKFPIKGRSRKRKRKCDNSEDTDGDNKKLKKSNSKSKSRKLNRRKKTKKRECRKMAATSTIVSKTIPQKEIKKEKKPKLKSVVIKTYQSSASSSSEYQESCDYDESAAAEESESSWDF